MPSPAPWSPASFPRGNAHGLPCVVPDVFLSAWTFHRGVILRKCSWVCLFHLMSRLGELSVLRLTSLPLFFLSCKLDYFFFKYDFRLTGMLGDIPCGRKAHLPFVCMFTIFRVSPHLLPPCPLPHMCVFIPTWMYM